jgi:hypothetical protein
MLMMRPLSRRIVAAVGRCPRQLGPAGASTWPVETGDAGHRRGWQADLVPEGDLERPPAHTQFAGQGVDRVR